MQLTHNHGFQNKLKLLKAVNHKSDIVTFTFFVATGFILLHFVKVDANSPEPVLQSTGITGGKLNRVAVQSVRVRSKLSWQHSQGVTLAKDCRSQVFGLN